MKRIPVLVDVVTNVVPKPITTIIKHSDGTLTERVVHEDDTHLYFHDTLPMEQLAQPPYWPLRKVKKTLTPWQRLRRLLGLR